MTRLVLAVIVCLAATPRVLNAQRELHWDELAVTARLGADGVLDVEERHAMVFTGDWNGGERVFNIRPRQNFELIGVERIDEATGVARPLEKASVPHRVDEFALTDRRTLRWRSRLPEDPPFANTRLTYIVRYKLSGILVKDAEQYRLAHDFAFPDRAGSIARFSLNLSVDPGWQPLTDLRQRYTAGPLAPGQSFVLTIPLRYAGTLSPIAFDRRSPAIVGGVAAILGAFVLGVAAFFVRERALGRFASTSPAGVDASWIEEHILTHSPGVIARDWKIQLDQVVARGGSFVSPVPIVVLGLAGAVSFGWTAYAYPDFRFGVIFIFLVAVFVGFLLQMPARWFRSRLDFGLLAAAVALLPAAIVSAAAAALLWWGSAESSWTSIAGLAAWVICISNAAIDGLKSRQPAEAIAFQRRLERARRFFKTELRKSNPALRDSWYPWMRALGLRKHVDSWATRHGREAARTSTSHESTAHSSTTGTSSVDDSGWTGGGGRSGGAGASTTWAAAAAAWVAAAVSAPSGSEGGSGSDGGSSDSGSSSGGGGGGGW
jgi:uncharacterized membrane protein YgcG